MILFLTHVFFYDIWFYMSHVLLHRPQLYWIHKLHHSKLNPTFPDTYLGHPLESPLQGLGFLVPFATQIPFNWVETTLALLFVNVRGILRHDARTAWLVGTHHLLHHQHFTCNYGEYWIDAICGTLRTC